MHNMLLKFIKYNSGCFKIKQIDKYLNKHILKILETDQEKLKSLQPYFQKIIVSHKSQNQQLITSKMNMLYNVHNLSGAANIHSSILSNMIIQDRIKCQSQLDRIVEWIRIQIRKNKEIDPNLIIQLTECAQKNQSGNRSKQFQITLENIVGQETQKGKELKSCMNKICKQLRQKFLSLDSKYIFQKVKQCIEKNKISTLNTNNINNIQKTNKFWDKIDNIKPRMLLQQCNTKQIYEQHLEIIAGRPRFRFPPQPNGYLHIGHVKSIRINFQTARKKNGLCFLRYDDTNPQTQTPEYIKNIQDNVRWLGYNPDKITYASDYFEQMMNYANELIKNGHAYICDTSQDEIETQRKNQLSNPFRNREIQQNLKIFPNLSSGQTLRLKGDPQAANPNLRDPIIYRLKHKQHPKTGYKYKIYPIYDFAHCISDSIEHIDYSLCSLQFQVRRQLYYRYLHLLNLYKPIVWQYSRLNIQQNVLSKRKIKSFIQSNVIQSWNDPRLLTLQGLKSRGFSPQMLKQFIDKVNSSRSGNQNIIKYNILQRQMKKQLYDISKKIMGVINPIQAQILNLNEKKIIHINCRTNNVEQMKEIILDRKIYVEKTDNFILNQEIILKYVGIFKILSVTSSKITLQFIKDINHQNSNSSLRQIPKYHWISQQNSIQYSIQFYDSLLNQDGSYNENSKVVVERCRIPKDILQENQKYWQFQRVGYFGFNLRGKKQLIRCCSL